MGTPRRPNSPKDKTLATFKQCNTEVREACGLRDRLIANLSPEELQELAGTYLFEGYDGLRSKYGLSRGEVLALMSTASWLQVLKTAASAMRAQVLTRTMLSLSRLFDQLENKVDKSPMVQDAIDALETAKTVFLEVGGIAPVTAAQGPIEPAAFADRETEKLRDLQEHLFALADAKLIRETPLQKADSRDSNNGNGNGHHADAA